MKEKIHDLIDSAKGEIRNILLEEAVLEVAGEVTKKFLKGAALETVTQGAEILIPGVGKMVLSYKQKRMERNIEEFLRQIINRQDEINERLSKLEKDQFNEVQNNYFGLITDYVPNVKQKEKMEYIVNGFVNVAGGMSVQEDEVLMLYDTLDQLNLLDIRIMKIYFTNKYLGVEYSDNINNVINDNDLSRNQLIMIKEKLERLGLIYCRMDEEMLENIQIISQFMEDTQRGKKNAKIKKLNKIKKSDSYKITPYGKRFMTFFLQAND